MKSSLVAFIFVKLFLFDLNAQQHLYSKLNIPYVSDADSLQQLDVFWNQKKKDCPVLVFVHGGGFLSGNKADYREMAFNLSKKGVTVVLVNYRFSPRVKYPSHHEDVAAAIDWVAQNISRFGGSTKKLFLMGHSAGGHIAALMVADRHFLDQYHFDQSNIKGVIVVSGVFEVKPQDGGASLKYLGMVFGDDPLIWKESSCQAHLERGKKLPPFLVAWSTEENPLIVRESTNFIEALQNVDGDLKSYEFTGQNHYSFREDLINANSEFYWVCLQMMGL